MKLAVIADLHEDGSRGRLPERRGEWAAVLLRRAVLRLNRFIRPDAVFLAGDLLENGAHPDAGERYRALREILDRLEMPWLAVPGNHDADPDFFYRFFPRPPERLDVAGVRLLAFCDPWAPDYTALREPEELARSAAAGEGWDGPVVALQHVPLFPPGTSDCPYNYRNAGEAVRAARNGGIALVVAGHYHAGVAPVYRDGMTFLAAPAFCESPFRFLEIDVEAGRDPVVTEHALRMPEGLPLAESHVHTELAYCSEDLTADRACELAALMGVEAMAFAEHSGQLYFDADTFWKAAFMDEGLAYNTGRDNRMRTYFDLLAAVGLPPERTGLEVDFDHRGRMVLDPVDRARAGFLLGSYHWTPEIAAREAFDPGVCAARLDAIWKPMLASGIDVLAHPFRLFNRKDSAAPVSLFRDLAGRLAAAGVAAELNFHTEEPHPAFVRACLEAGVRLSLGTDSHGLHEVAEFWPHLRLLRGLGVRDSDLEEVLWRPAAIGGRGVGRGACPS